MKKKLIILAGSVMALAICATTYFSANANSDVSLLMQNVEALAVGEGAGGSYNQVEEVTVDVWDEDSYTYVKTTTKVCKDPGATIC